ncbi:MAG TPA: ATP-binding protein [Gaiellaceae bacterium]|nr:ATP-binding protein [Gaiellaceae bacterium]
MSRRFLATYVALAVVVLASLEIPLGIQYGRSERRDLTGRIERDALTMATFAEDTLERGLQTPPPGLVRVANQYQRDPGGRVVIVDRTGLSLLDTNPPFPGRRSFASRPELAAALRGDIASGTRHSSTLGTDLIYVAVPISSGGVVRGAVRITYPTSALDSRVRRYWLLLAAIGGVVLAAATVVGLRFARTLTEPLSALEDAAAAVGAGDLQARAPADSGPPEIRALASEFNHTVSRLEALVRSQDEFVADASHQLRTPLAALRLRLENLERDVGEAGKDDLTAALAELSRLSRLVDGLLALARADAAKPAPTSLDVREAVSARVDAWSAELAERGVVADVRLTEPLHALATPGAMEQILDNLVSNALAVSEPGDTITIEGRSSGDGVVLHVRDEGPGMSAEQRARAFDRFWRAGSPGGGTGLGLAIVHRLVTADDGEVVLREAEGGGLDVVVTLRAAS